MQLISNVGVETRAFIYDSFNSVDCQCLLGMGMIKRLDCINPILLSSVICFEFRLNSLLASRKGPYLHGSIEGCVKMQLIPDVGVETRAFIYDSFNSVDCQCLLRMGMIKRLDCINPILLSSVIFFEFRLNSLLASRTGPYLHGSIEGCVKMQLISDVGVETRAFIYDSFNSVDCQCLLRMGPYLHGSIEGCAKMQLISDVGVETRAFIYDSFNSVDCQCLLRMGMIKRLDCINPILLSSVIFFEFRLNYLHGLEGPSRIKDSMVLSFIAKCG